MIENVPRKRPGKAVNKKIYPFFSSYKIDDLTPVEKHSNELILVLTMSHDLNEAVVESEKGR